MENNTAVSNITKKEKIKKMVIYILYAVAIAGYIIICLKTRRQIFAVTFVFFMLGLTGIYTFFSETKRRFPIFFGIIEMGSIVIFIKLFYVIYNSFIKPYMLYKQMHG